MCVTPVIVSYLESLYESRWGTFIWFGYLAHYLCIQNGLCTDIFNFDVVVGSYLYNVKFGKVKTYNDKVYVQTIIFAYGHSALRRQWLSLAGAQVFNILASKCETLNNGFFCFHVTPISSVGLRTSQKMAAFFGNGCDGSYMMFVLI